MSDSNSTSTNKIYPGKKERKRKKNRRNELMLNSEEIPEISKIRFSLLSAENKKIWVIIISDVRKEVQW